MLLSADLTIILIVAHLFTWASKTFISLTSHRILIFIIIILWLTFKRPCYICRLLQANSHKQDYVSDIKCRIESKFQNWCGDLNSYFTFKKEIWHHKLSHTCSLTAWLSTTADFYMYNYLSSQLQTKGTCQFHHDQLPLPEWLCGWLPDWHWPRS